MLCTQCGNENPAGNRFCGECGAKLQAPTVSEAETPIVSEPEAPVVSESQLSESRFSESAATEAKSRPVAPKLDLRDPTDPGRIIVPANGRNATHVPADEPAAVMAEPPAHEVGETLDDAVVYRGNEQVYAEPVEPRHYMAAAGELESAPPPRRDTSIHGPSLLGLSDDEFNSNAKDDSGTTDYSYLYDDEGGGGGRTVNWRLMFALVVLIGFGGVLAYMWSQGKSWNTVIVRGGGSQQKQAPPVVAKNEPTTPGAPEIAVGATQKPVPADEKPQSDGTADASKNNAAGANGTNAAAKPTDNPAPGDAKNAGATGAPTDISPAGAAKDAGAGAAAAAAGDSKDAKAAGSKTADSKPSDKPDNKQATKNAAPADNADDEEDAEATAPAKSAKGTAAAATRGGKASAAKAARADNSDTDDIASVHRADALLKSHSCNQAVDLLREAALHGNATARSRLGGLYATGQCVPLDRAEAYNWFTLAKDAGAHYSWIEHNRSMLWAQMSQSERERVMRR